MSRQKSGRSKPAAAPTRGGGAAPRGGRPGGVFVQSPRSDIFVALLGVALAAILVGCILLVLVLNRYEFQTKAAALTPQSGGTMLASIVPSENFSTVRL